MELHLLIPQELMETLFHLNTHHLHHPITDTEQPLELLKAKELHMELAQPNSLAMEELQELPQLLALIKVDQAIRLVEDQLELLQEQLVPQLELLPLLLQEAMDQDQELEIQDMELLVDQEPEQLEPLELQELPELPHMDQLLELLELPPTDHQEIQVLDMEL